MTTVSTAHPLGRARAHLGERPALVLAVIAVGLAAWLIGADGLRAFLQTSVNGLVAGSYYALGAVGLTLVYGILRLVNFAHGDFLTLAAYVAVGVTVASGVPYAVAVVAAVAATAALGVTLERVLFKPMRRRDAGTLQLFLITIGLAFLIRNGIQLVAGSRAQHVDIDVTSTVSLLGLRVGVTQAIIVVVGLLALSSVAALLRWTTLGRQMRAVADDFDLAEATGIDTGRVVIWTWVLAGGLAGLAGGLLGAAAGAITPVTGSFLLLNLFAAVVLGGIGNARGALVGGLLIGLMQEWSTLQFGSSWKLTTGFVVLILVLIVRPQGLFGRGRAV